MAKTVKISYNADSLKTTITVDGKEFDTSRIDGREIEDWAYPFQIRKVKWNGFYDEIVAALGGEKAFDLVFDGSDESLAELKEALEDVPVKIVKEAKKSEVIIKYDSDSLKTTITVDGKEFDTSRIDGREIEDWVYPFQMRKVKWNGIFNELADFIGSDNYNITFSGKDEDINSLKEECPKTVNIEKDSNASSESAEELENQAKQLDSKEKYEESFKLRMKAADMGNVISINNIGCHYEHGNGVEQNYTEAAKWYQKAAEQGNAGSQNNLANCYYDGNGVNQDYAEAAKWYRKAAEQGYVFAQDNLGDCYYNGEGVEQNYAEAVKWYQKAAEQGNQWAQFKLGFCYNFGEGVEQNYAEAAKWYQKAAEQGNADAQRSLGNCYYDGEGVEQNYAEAAKWYRKAAEQGNQYAQDNLSVCYFVGSGVNQNYFEAVKWSEKAVEQGNADAYYILGTCYRWGYGVHKDKEKAKELFKKGIELGDQSCKEAYEEMLKNADRIGTAKNVGGKILSFLGAAANNYAQASLQSYNDDDDNYYYDDDDEY